MNKHGQSFKVGPPSEHQSSSHIYNITVSPNASSSLDAALSTGLASYNPLSTITLYFASGRNQITANSKVIPAMLAVINPILTKAAIQHTAAFLGANTANTSALSTAERCPQCLAAPFAISELDLRPFDVAPATGTTMVGMIFVRIPKHLSSSFLIFIHLTYSTIPAPHLRLLRLPNPPHNRHDHWFKIGPPLRTSFPHNQRVTSISVLVAMVFPY